MKLPPGSKRSATDFEKEVYKLCSKVPAGKVTTYAEIAQVLASSARAVGQALRRNPFAPSVPCHRVVTSDLKLGGFFGQTGKMSSNVQKKRQILIDEAVVFEGEDRISQESLHTFDTRLTSKTKLRR
mmetsp:Transcript_53042/g.108123  ORF Transcript_53042/g.108123 Transcript_53042/m.108123 type:complete len:127 (-) Transcript_53042:132-512(-)|eukprot:CAMPEP_0181314144 /NCGR_PEP_ID=MMETSP1101-20121128/14651_1 /TAXON_ID=46948 /ORGANISM="Rhodomonas abbreviata, Strain Caron Lab Isolate" /LENGTH=126 /DNA_ID=CAMNT_0023421197 /DNA_START=33 /DNA_END=413 /DNA_ORIENTATION=-